MERDERREEKKNMVIRKHEARGRVSFNWNTRHQFILKRLYTEEKDKFAL